MVQSVLLVTSLYIIDVLYEWSPTLIFFFLQFFIVQDNDLLIHSDIVSGSSKNHLFETPKILSNCKNMSIKPDYQKTLTPINLLDDVFLNSEIK